MPNPRNVPEMRWPPVRPRTPWLWVLIWCAFWWGVLLVATWGCTPEPKPQTSRLREHSGAHMLVNARNAGTWELGPTLFVYPDVRFVVFVASPWGPAGFEFKAKLGEGGDAYSALQHGVNQALLEQAKLGPTTHALWTNHDNSTWLLTPQTKALIASVNATNPELVRVLR